MSYCIDRLCIEVVKFRGHTNVRALHKTTLEITKDTELTPRGDCIIGVAANKALKEFNEGFKRIIRNRNSLLIVVLITSRGHYDILVAKGDERLTYDDKRKIIIRKSTYIAGNTAGINANKASADLNRELINDLRNGADGYAIFIALSKA